MMLRPAIAIAIPLAPIASTVTATHAAAFGLPALAVRGGEAAFGMGLVKTRIEGLASIASTATATHAAAFGLPVLAVRGGEAAFDMGLAKTRIEGLAYSTVSTLLMNAALRLFSATPKKLEHVPNDAEEARRVRFNNSLKVMFAMCMSASVALGLYTTTLFTLMSIYSKTALGMGLQSEYLRFFDSCARYRDFGFWAFIGTIFSYNIAWILSLVLNFEGEVRWWIPLPAIIIGSVGFVHYKTIVGIAGSLLYCQP